MKDIEADVDWRSWARPFTPAEIDEFESRFAEYEQYDLLFGGLWPDAQERDQ